MNEVVHGRGCNSVSMMASAAIFSVFGPICVKKTQTEGKKNEGKK
jgi:hypothetical protein